MPPPQVDAAGAVKTVYAIFFPKTITISEGGMVGGEPGGFCAYHSTIRQNGLSVPYMVLPDFNTHGFALGCGTDPQLFNNFTSVTSHELVESITDPDVENNGWGDVNLQMEIGIRQNNSCDFGETLARCGAQCVFAKIKEYVGHIDDQAAGAVSRLKYLVELL